MTDPSPTHGGNGLERDTDATPVTVHWRQTWELGYEMGHNSGGDAPAKSSICFRCGQRTAKLCQCARCNVAAYCSKDCQVQDWKPSGKGGGGHKATCAAYGRLRLENGTVLVRSAADRETIRNELLGRIRIYACSYAVHRTCTLGRGFLFLQSDSTLATLSTPGGKDAFGYPGPMRAILMHFLTVPEYEGEVCRDDFEMMHARPKLQELVAEYDEQTQLVLLMRFRCGHVALGTAPLVPDYRVCKVLGQQYYAENQANAVQLNLDDV